MIKKRINYIVSFAAKPLHIILYIKIVWLSKIILSNYQGIWISKEATRSPHHSRYFSASGPFSVEYKIELNSLLKNNLPWYSFSIWARIIGPPNYSFFLKKLSGETLIVFFSKPFGAR